MEFTGGIMTFLEDIGEATIKIMQKAFYYFIGFLIKSIEIAREVDRRVALSQKIKPYRYFERRGVDFNDYTVLKVQLSTLAFLIFSVFFIFDFLSFQKFIVIALISGLYSLYTLFSQVKKYFRQDFNAYRDFFVSYLGISIVLVLLKIFIPRINFAFPYIHFVVVSIAAVYLVSFIFKKKHARDYTFGRVVEIKDKVKVKINYDICASVKPGVYAFEKANAREGDRVKIKVEKGFLNLRGAKITEVMGVVDER
jgi:uncharacterized membrane protein